MMNTDFNERIALETSSIAWLSSADGCATKPLDGDAASDYATCLLAMQPGTVWVPPGAGLGEEILVLAGALDDERTRYGPGTYLRNPQGLTASLRSETGCELFVKRYPFAPSDTARVRRDTAAAEWLPGLVAGLSVMPLHQHQHEHAALVWWQPNTYFQAHAHFGGEEILVLSGVFEDEFGRYPTGTWMRSPHMSRHQPYSREGCMIYVKTGHLSEMDGA
jgi:anti-sigma factor ChrR (cupin superfamily)